MQICETSSNTDCSGLNSSDAEVCYNIIIYNINDLIEYFAYKKISAKHKIREPWITPESCIHYIRTETL